MIPNGLKSVDSFFVLCRHANKVLAKKAKHSSIKLS